MSIPKTFLEQKTTPVALYEHPFLLDDPNEQTKPFSLPNPPEIIPENKPAKTKYPQFLTLFFASNKSGGGAEHRLAQNTSMRTNPRGGGC